MRCLLLLLRDRLQYIAGFGDMRQVDLGLELIHRRAAARAAARRARFAMLLVVLLDLLGFIHFDRARVRLLFCNSDLYKKVKDHFALNLKFSCEVINSDFLLHSALFPSDLFRPGYAVIAPSSLVCWACGGNPQGP
jgi:hypothetical protein